MVTLRDRDGSAKSLIQRSWEAAMAVKDEVRAMRVKMAKGKGAANSKAKVNRAKRDKPLRGANRAKVLAKAKKVLPNANKLCATNCAASKARCPAKARLREMRHGVRLIVRVVQWTGQKKHCAGAIWQMPSIIKRKQWKRCARGCGH